MQYPMQKWVYGPESGSKFEMLHDIWYINSEVVLKFSGYGSILAECFHFSATIYHRNVSVLGFNYL